MLNLGQVKIDQEDNTIPSNINMDSFYIAEAKLGYLAKKEKERIAIHKEIYRVSLESQDNN